MGESRSATALLRVHPARTRDRLRRPAHRSRLHASGARNFIPGNHAKVAAGDRSVGSAPVPTSPSSCTGLVEYRPEVAAAIDDSLDSRDIVHDMEQHDIPSDDRHARIIANLRM